MDTRGSGTIRAALATDRFRPLVAAHALSAVGQSLPTVALVAYVFERTHSPGWAAAATVLRLIPNILFSAPSGVVGDRCDRRRVMMACNAAAAVPMVGVAALAIAGAPPIALLVLAFLAAALGTAHYPALAAATPAVVGPANLLGANAVVSTIEASAFVVGPALGGLMLVVLAPSAVFLVAALVLAGAAWCVWATPPWDPREADTDAPGPVRDDLDRRLASPYVTRLITLVLLTELLYGCVGLLLVFVADDLLSTGTKGYGLLNAAFGGGALAAIALTSRLSRLSRPSDALVVCTLASGLPFAVLVAARTPWAAVVLLVVAGVASTVVEVLAKTMLQSRVGDAQLARLFGVLDSLACLSILVGSLVTPLLVSRFGLETTLVVVGVALPLLAVAAGPPGGRRLLHPHALEET